MTLKSNIVKFTHCLYITHPFVAAILIQDIAPLQIVLNLDDDQHKQVYWKLHQDNQNITMASVIVKLIYVG